MSDFTTMGAEDLSALPASQFTLTHKGQLAVDYGDPRLTRQQIALLTAIAFLQDREQRMAGDRGLMYTLAETKPGICPVCKFDWASDPSHFCHCTAPHPDDDVEAGKAYAVSAMHRGIKRRNDQAAMLAADEAAIHQLGRRIDAKSSNDAVVIPIGRRRRSRKQALNEPGSSTRMKGRKRTTTGSAPAGTAGLLPPNPSEPAKHPS